MSHVMSQSAGKAKSSVVASLLSGLDDSKDNAARETMIQNTAGTAYTGNSTSLVFLYGPSLTIHS